MTIWIDALDREMVEVDGRTIAASRAFFRG